MMKLGGIQKYSTIDFPGVLSCVIFTRGCDLDCFYCHNRTLLMPGELLNEADVFAFLKKRQGLLDGVVVSGGEPTLQEDLPLFIKQIKELGFKIKLDTNGQNPDVVEALCKEILLDYVAVDIKATNQAYETITGKKGYEKAVKTIKVLQKYKIDFEVRTTLYPSMDINELFVLLSSLPQMPRWRLNYFVMPEVYKKEDANRLLYPHLTQKDIGEHLNMLIEKQPNLIFD